MIYGIITFFIVFVIGYRLSLENNPYIKTHKAKWKNEKDYGDYIKWLDASGGDIPLNEIKTKEEKELINKINQTLT